jgi:hypothetical protein
MMAVVQDYLSALVSLQIGNLSRSDIEYSLPDDIRKLTDMKVDAWTVTRQTVSAGAGQAFNATGNATSLFLVFFSHPVQVTKIDNASLVLNTSFVGFWTDRSDGTNSMDMGATNSVLINNDLRAPNYVTTSGGSTTAVEVTVVEVALSTTA